MGKTAEPSVLKVTHLRIVFFAVDTLHLPQYTGSTWRGLFGRALKQQTCTTWLPRCEPCDRRFECHYSEIFDSPVPPGSSKMRLYPSSPPPYVIRPGQHGPLAAGQRGHIDFLLYGKACRHASLITETMQRASTIGIGPSSARFSIDEIQQLSLTPDPAVIGRYQPQEISRARLSPAVLAPAAAPLTAHVELLSPLRIRIAQKPVGASSFNMRALYATLLRRYTSLCYFHGGFEPQLEFKALLDAAANIPVSNRQLRWKDGKRYSSRQGAEVPLGGIIGQFDISGPLLAGLWPLLWSGQWLHVGKSVVMGLGQYKITPASLPRN